jgi:hypothetical protein
MRDLPPRLSAITPLGNAILGRLTVTSDLIKRRQLIGIKRKAEGGFQDDAPRAPCLQIDERRS